MRRCYSFAADDAILDENDPETLLKEQWHTVGAVGHPLKCHWWTSHRWHPARLPVAADDVGDEFVGEAGGEELRGGLAG